MNKSKFSVNLFIGLPLILSGIFFSSISQAMGTEAPEENFVETVYLCDPTNRRTNLEGITVRDDESIGIYTTSRSWGAVDEHIFFAEKSEDHTDYVFSSQVGTVRVAKKQSRPIRLGDQVMGSFHDFKSDQVFKLVCEYMHQP